MKGVMAATLMICRAVCAVTIPAVLADAAHLAAAANKASFQSRKPHIQALIMQRTVEARAVGMRIIHGKHFPHGPAAVRLVAHQIFTFFDGDVLEQGANS